MMGGDAGGAWVARDARRADALPLAGCAGGCLLGNGVMMSRLMAAVSGMVRGTLLRGARSGRRQRRTWSTEAVECRCLLSGTAIGDLVQTYPVTVQFSELGHLGDARVFGDTLFVPGNRNDGSPIAWKVNLTTGASESIAFSGSGNISGVIQRNGEFAFTGFLDTATGRRVTYWDDTGEHVSAALGDIFDVSSLGRIVGTRAGVDAFYLDVGTDNAVSLPGISGMYVGANSITNDGRFIGSGAFNDNLDSVGIVYEQQADGSYELLDVQYVTPDGLSLLRMDVVDGPEGPLGVGNYADVNGAVQIALWGVEDAVFKTHLGAGYASAAVYESGYLFASTTQGIVTATNLANLQTETYTATTLFGSTKDFKTGALFVTADGNLGVVGTDPVTKFATVKTFKIPQNTAPVVSAWDGTVSFVENAQPVVLDANALVSDGDSSDCAGGSVTVSLVSHGEAADRLSVRHVGNSAGQIGVSGNGISYGGVLIGTMTGGSNGSTPLVVTLNSAANAQSVTALLRAVTFQNVSDSPSTQTRQVQVTVADGDGGASAAVTKAVSVTAVNDAPVILAFDGSVTYTENAVPVLLDTNASATDGDGLNIGVGILHIMITANGQATDRLAIRNVGTGAGQISVTGNTIKLGNVICATFTGGMSASSPLVVTFAPSATTASATSILRALTFDSVSENPSVLPRTIRVLMTDNVGKFSAPVVKTVSVVAVNDAPVIAAFDGSVTYTENAVPVLLDSNASASDPDGVSIGGGLLHIMITANGQPTDRLAIRNIGTGPGQISVTGNTIKLGNVICATFTGGTSGSSPLVVTLAPSATTASATSILRALTFASVSENPSVLPRTIRVLMTDNVGRFSAPVFKTVTVVAVNDAPVISSWDSPLSTVGNAHPILLDSSAAVTDVDSSNFSGGKLTLWISANAHGFDRLAVRSVGNSTGQIGVSGSSVRFGGVLIGTFVGGTSGTVPLVVTLNSSATPAAVTALLRSLTYKFAGTSSARVVKTVSVSLTDGDGGTSSSVAKLLTLERTL
jgi:peroxiredoxin